MKNRQTRKHLDQSFINQLSEDVKNNSELDIAAETFAMLGNLPRLRILYVLSKTGQCCVHHLAGILDMSITNVSHHLRKMHDRRIVKKKRDGLNIYYLISHDEGVYKACKIAEKLLEIDSEI